MNGAYFGLDDINRRIFHITVSLWWVKIRSNSGAKPYIRERIRFASCFYTPLHESGNRVRFLETAVTVTLVVIHYTKVEY